MIFVEPIDERAPSGAPIRRLDLFGQRLANDDLDAPVLRGSRTPGPVGTNR
jgi:hypothetical protein